MVSLEVSKKPGWNNLFKSDYDFVSLGVDIFHDDGVEKVHIKGDKENVVYQGKIKIK